MVAEQYPWPPVDGYRQRLSAMIGGLARLGPVEVMALERTTADAPGPRPGPPEGVASTTLPSEGAIGIGGWGRSWARPGAPPRRVLSLDWAAARHELERRLGDPSEPVDLVWFSHVDTWWPLGDLSTGIPTVLDFDNLEHLALHLRRWTRPRTDRRAGSGANLRTVARWAGSRAFDLVDEGRWDRIQRAAAAQVDAVVVCSELDRTRSGCPNAVVVGNGATAPAAVHRDRRELRGATPTLLFVGALDYEPNTDAVDWFVREVFPLVRRRRPDAAVRIVGRGADQVGWVREVDGVELVGPVDDLAVELAGADVAIVPIRVGAGTRLKVVEALANHLPLVTTTVGCEGIDVTDDVSARLADDAEGFAAACVALLGDPGARQRLADAGAALFAERYEWSAIQSDVAELAGRVAAREPIGR